MKLILGGVWWLCFACSGGPVSAPEAPPLTPPEPAVVASPMLLELGGVAEVETQKNGDTLVGATVEGIEGELHVRNVDTWEGLQGVIRVPISSFNTGLELRDQRIQEVFFGSKTRPHAILEFSRAEGFGEVLSVGATQTLSVPAEISVGGGKGSVVLDLAITREGSRRYSAVSVNPSVLSISDLGLGEPLARLIELCAHASIRDEVKVSFKASVTD